jgi:hypothetical protein
MWRREWALGSPDFFRMVWRKRHPTGGVTVDPLVAKMLIYMGTGGYNVYGMGLCAKNSSKFQKEFCYCAWPPLPLNFRIWNLWSGPMFTATSSVFASGISESGRRPRPLYNKFFFTIPEFIFLLPSYTLPALCVRKACLCFSSWLDNVIYYIYNLFIFVHKWHFKLYVYKHVFTFISLYIPENLLMGNTKCSPSYSGFAIYCVDLWCQWYHYKFVVTEFVPLHNLLHNWRVLSQSKSYPFLLFW